MTTPMDNDNYYIEYLNISFLTDKKYINICRLSDKLARNGEYKQNRYKKVRTSDLKRYVNNNKLYDVWINKTHPTVIDGLMYIFKDSENLCLVLITSINNVHPDTDISNLRKTGMKYKHIFDFLKL